MKIALLLYGYIGSIQKKNSTINEDISREEQELFLQLCYNHWKKYLLNDKYDVDIYIHSWDVEYKDLLIKYFKPKKIDVEKGYEDSKLMRQYKSIIKFNGINLTNNGRINQLIGIKKVWELFKEHANGYDIIIHSRPAMCLHKEIPFNKLEKDKIYTTELRNGTKGLYQHNIHGFFEDPIISTSIIASNEYSSGIDYLLDKEKYKLWKQHDGYFNNSLNCVSAHRTTYHILHILKKNFNIEWKWIPDFIYTNHYHSSSFNFARHLYFGHLDLNNRRGRDPMFDNMDKSKELQLEENKELINNFYNKTLKKIEINTQNIINNMNNLKLIPYSFPILKSHNFINNDLYYELKNNYPNFKDFRTTSAGQVNRNNIELKKGNYNYLKIHKSYQQLYNHLNSTEFRNLLCDRFEINNTKIMNELGYIGDFYNSELILHIAESTTGYENPWHVDTRGRIIHFLIYFGMDYIEEGGELAIGEHIKLDNMIEYTQYPNINKLNNIQKFKPNDNLGIFILSQNNAYHKGCYLKGKRRFIYGGYTNKNGPAWKTGIQWQNGGNFIEQLKVEKQINN